MHMPHSDLGLLHDLRALSVLLEERNVTRAALRFHLSQPAMSRTLQRLRGLFGDELLVRSGGDYELTPRARTMQHELALLLPRLQNFVAGKEFDPTTATGIVRIVGTDYTTSTLGPYLLPKLFLAAPDLEVRIEQREHDSYTALEGGRADIALSVLRPAGPLRWDKAPCRFCGTGCHVQVGVREGRVVAIVDDLISEEDAARALMDAGGCVTMVHYRETIDGSFVVLDVPSSSVVLVAVAAAGSPPARGGIPGESSGISPSRPWRGRSG
jgi:DNA-binding transcriptional LysR family regulator